MVLRTPCMGKLVEFDEPATAAKRTA